MQLNQKMMMSLAAIAVIMLVMITGTNGQIFNRPIECCTSVSDKEITLPITGFKLQKYNPPCVNAVILETKMNSTDSTPLSTASPHNSTSA
ncbi:hypothetical protein cypCar_00003274 [Cyprinus carpio]|nr:hypothetical protein cypCar_00003274 [Cyprinus carpio]